VIKSLSLLFLLIVLMSVSTAATAQIPNRASLVRQIWEVYKANYITCGDPCGGSSGLVYDPYIGYQAVSEGVGYGMLLAVALDDQVTFNAVYLAGDAIMRDESTGLHHWRVNNRGEITGEGSATDAEQDIALALIFAQQRVDRGEWQRHPDLPYGERATALLNAIWRYEVVAGRYLKPGDRFSGGGQEILNLSYFSPAWYRIYDQFEAGDRWQALIDQGYDALFSTQGSERGLAPDWSTIQGGPATEYCQTHGMENCAYDMGYDAIRVPWRVGLDCLWFQDESACEWSQRSVRFLTSLPESRFARLYDMQGGVIVDYQDEAMLSMWLIAALAAEDSTLQRRIENLLNARIVVIREQNFQGNEARFYYNQSLLLFGLTLLSEEFQNFMKDPD
jgi:endo-1,4-beta-D-glucanase Y